MPTLPDPPPSFVQQSQGVLALLVFVATAAQFLGQADYVNARICEQMYPSNNTINRALVRIPSGNGGLDGAGGTAYGALFGPSAVHALQPSTSDGRDEAKAALRLDHVQPKAVGGWDDEKTWAPLAPGAAIGGGWYAPGLLRRNPRAVCNSVNVTMKSAKFMQWVRTSPTHLSLITCVEWVRTSRARVSRGESHQHDHHLTFATVRCPPLVLILPSPLTDAPRHRNAGNLCECGPSNCGGGGGGGALRHHRQASHHYHIYYNATALWGSAALYRIF
jgi:hypothetical protein